MLEMRKSVSSDRSSLLRTRAGLRAATIRTSHSTKPDEQQDLPEASEIDVFITLAAEPEPHIAKTLLDAKPFAGERSADHENQCTEECVDTEPLVLRFVSADGRANIESGGQPRRRDPEDGDLQMPGAGDGVGQILGERESKEGLSLDTVVSGQDAHQNLHAPEDHHHIEVFQRRTLRRGGLECEEWILFRIRPMNEFLFLRCIPPDQAADSRQQADEAQNAPEDGARCRYIADQRLMRPVVRVGRLRTGTIRAASPRGPPEECGKLMLLRSVGQCAAAGWRTPTGPWRKRQCSRREAVQMPPRGRRSM